MNLEFHYYAVHFLASRAGFSEDEARTLATASQYVDDAIVEYEVESGGEIYRGITHAELRLLGRIDIGLSLHTLPFPPR